MSIKDKLANAQTTDWLTEGISDLELKQIKDLASISAAIELRRKDLGMSQKEFSAYMGVSQAMVSKWESGEYNFTISSLNEICYRLDLDFRPEIYNPHRARNPIKVINIRTSDMENTCPEIPAMEN